MGRTGDGLKEYYKGKIEELEIAVRDKAHNLRRLEAQRNDLNTKGWRPVIRRERIIPDLESSVFPQICPADQGFRSHASCYVQRRASKGMAEGSS